MTRDLENAAEVAYRDIYTTQGKVETCKEYKIVNNCSLMEAKTQIELMVDKYGWKTPYQQSTEPFAYPKSRNELRRSQQIRKHRKQIEGAARILNDAGLTVAATEIGLRSEQLRKDEIREFVNEVSFLKTNESDEDLVRQLAGMAAQFRTFANK